VIGGRIFAGVPEQIEGIYLRINAREDRREFIERCAISSSRRRREGDINIWRLFVELPVSRYDEIDIPLNEREVKLREKPLVN
jgi:hypothetical protein